jgi:NAD(P)H-hydrate epimerase
MPQIIDRLHGAADSRAIDASAISALDVTGYELMHRAAHFAFDRLLAHWPGIKRLTVFCGKGNNAGDAYLLAMLAHEIGLGVQLIATMPPQELAGDAQRAYRAALGAGLTIDESAQSIDGDVVVDGLLGTGIRGVVDPTMAAAIERINQSACPVLSIDVPSGIHTDTGAVAGSAVVATVTCMFITRKIGLYTGAGVSCAGIREYSDLGVPASFMATPDAVSLSRFQPDALGPLDGNTYKHRQGHVLIVGGDYGMPGAVAMAAQAALRVGAGMVSVATRREHVAPIIARTPEVMLVDVDRDGLAAHAQRADFIVVGPGLGRTDWGQAAFTQALDEAERLHLPILIDADGLFWLAQLQRVPNVPTFITPHIAEAARLLDIQAADVQSDRLQAAQQLQQKYAGCGVLKGAGSVIFVAGRREICGHGNPGMATAGMGDVLSGMAAGLAVQSTDDQEDLFRTAVLLHSAAADTAAQRVGQRSLLATDVIAQIPQVMRGVSDE